MTGDLSVCTVKKVQRRERNEVAIYLRCCHWKSEMYERTWNRCKATSEGETFGSGMQLGLGTAEVTSLHVFRVQSRPCNVSLPVQELSMWMCLWLISSPMLTLCCPRRSYMWMRLMLIPWSEPSRSCTLVNSADPAHW